MKGDQLPKRPLTPGYIFFFILFLPDTWQILIAFVTAVLVTPRLMTPDMGHMASAIVHVMVAVIIYVVSAPIGRRISRLLQRLILGRPSSR